VAKRLILSASQFDTALDCLRKWWFERVARLPQERRVPDPRTFGDVLHEVCERFLAADEFGVDEETGEPVDLYPASRKVAGRWLPWTAVVSEFGEDKGEERSISVGEAELIQKLIAAAIDQGVLVRSPGGRIEARFDLPLAKTEQGSITVMGFRDYVPSRDSVDDHKSCKKDKAPWRKTPKALAKNPQMLVYGKSLLWEAEKRGEPAPAVIHLAHNQFVKDPDKPFVRRTKATVTREEIETWWTSVIVPLAHKLLNVREIKEWHNVPGAEEGSGACQKYGGCAFLKICRGLWSPSRYAKRIERKNRLPVASAACQTPLVVSPNSSRADETSTGTGDPMSFAAKLAAKSAKKSALSGAAPAASPAAAKLKPKPAAAKPKPAAPPAAAKPKPAAPPAAAPKIIGDTPPWASSDCRACEGVGFNSKGSPCRICDHKAKKAGGPTSAQFEIMADGGLIVWSDGETEGSAELISAEVAVAESEAPAEEAPAEVEVEEAPAEVEDETPAEVEVEVEDEDEDEGDDDSADAEDETPAEDKAKAAVAPKVKKRRPGRPSKGFTLLIGCNVLKGTGKIGTGSGVIFLDEVIARYGAALATEQGQDSFYDLNGFDRRDALCKVAEILAREFGTDYVVASPTNTEERDLLKVLRPLAATVIVGGSY
jgi:hypothetical protein